MEINFNVNDLIISCGPLPKVIGGSRNYITAKFNFNGSIWDENTIKTALFKCDGLPYSVILNDDTCIVPTEVLKQRSFKVGVQGCFIEGNRIQTVYTEYADVNVEPSSNDNGYKNGFTPGQYEQVMELIKRLQNTNGDPESSGLSFSERLEILEKKLDDGGYVKANRYTNVLVPSSNFVEDGTFEDYPYKADITIDGVKEDDCVHLVFSFTDVKSMKYAPVCDVNENTITIYATEMPADNLTIPLIEVIK